MKKTALALAVAAMTAATACSDKDSKLIIPEGRVFKVMEICTENGTEAMPASQDQYPDITFSEGKVSGFAGVNRFFGKFEYDSLKSIRFSPLGVTMMMGENMDLERAFLNGMEKVRFMKMDKDTTITLLDSLENKIMVLK